jgi:predicted RNase H-like nuclease (RuvC/YqgF family)
MKMIYSKGHHAYKKSCQQLDKFLRQKERLLRDIKETNQNIYKWQCAVNALKDEENKKVTKQQSNSADVGDNTQIENEARQPKVRRFVKLVEEKLPEFAKAAKSGEGDTILLMQEAFNNKEMFLFGSAIKYAGLHNKKVTVII